MNATVAGFIRKELGQAFRDPRMLALMFGAPVIQMTLLGYALNSEIRNIRLAVVASPGDIVASRLADRAFASGWFVPAETGRSNPADGIGSGKADAVLVMPEGGLTRALARGHATVQLLVDATNSVRARTVEFYLAAVLARMAEDGTVPVLGNRVRLDVRILYNPAMLSYLFMIPAVMVFVLTELTSILTAMALAREKEMGTMEMLIAAPVRKWEILVGKTVPYILIGCMELPLVILVVLGWFQVPMRGPAWALVLAAIFFVCAMSSVGTLISTLARNQQQAMMGSFMFMLSAIMLSGIFFPVENMPGLVRWITYANPLRYVLALLRNVMLKGGDPAVIWGNLVPLAMLAVVFAWAAIRRFRETLN